MDLFQTILAGIKSKIDSKSVTVENIARIASEILGIQITPSMVVQKGTHIIFTIPPTAKLVLSLKRASLLEALKKENSSIISIS